MEDFETTLFLESFRYYATCLAPLLLAILAVAIGRKSKAELATRRLALFLWAVGTTGVGLLGVLINLQVIANRMEPQVPLDLLRAGVISALVPAIVALLGCVFLVLWAWKRA